jgi:hypothetical protein
MVDLPQTFRQRGTIQVHIDHQLKRSQVGPGSELHYSGCPSCPTEGLIFSGSVRMQRQFNNLDFLYLGYEPEGREFESLRAHQLLLVRPGHMVSKFPAKFCHRLAG